MIIDDIGHCPYEVKRCDNLLCEERSGNLKKNTIRWGWRVGFLFVCNSHHHKRYRIPNVGGIYFDCSDYRNYGGGKTPAICSTFFFFNFIFSTRTTGNHVLYNNNNNNKKKTITIIIMKIQAITTTFAGIKRQPIYTYSWLKRKSIEKSLKTSSHCTPYIVIHSTNSTNTDTNT